MDGKLLERMKKLMENCKTEEDNYDCKKCRDFGYVFEKTAITVKLPYLVNV